MRLILCAAAAALISGCAVQAPPPSRPPPPITEAPKCSDKVACERMWIAAQQAVVSLTGMRLRMVTDQRIETYAPMDFGRTGAVVLMYPLGGNAYEIRADFECYGDCTQLRPLGINAFNSRVKLSGR